MTSKIALKAVPAKPEEARSITNLRRENGQEIHLWPAPWCPGKQVGRGSAAAPPDSLPLPYAPVALRQVASNGGLSAARDGERGPVVVVEPFFNRRKQLRLFAVFPDACEAQVNGQPAPGMVVLAPGDFVRWGPGSGFRVALFNKPQIGPPPASVLGKPCPVCSVPFDATATCVICVCGVVLHCEPDERAGLQCAQMRRTCARCQRPLVLTENYVNPPSDEE